MTKLVALYSPFTVKNPIKEKNMASSRTKKLAFLCTPYTNSNGHVRSTNLRIANCATLFLMQKGLSVFSPVSHGAQILSDVEDKALHRELIPFQPWEELNLSIMEACDCLVWVDNVTTFQSQGMRAEIKHAEEIGLPIIGLRYHLETGSFAFIDGTKRRTALYPTSHTIEEY